MLFTIDLETNNLRQSLKEILNNYKNIVLINNAGKIFNGLVQMTSNEKFLVFGLNFLLL